MKLLTIPTVTILYILFSIAAMFAGLWGVLSLITGTKRISRICQAMDRLLAAMLGWDGRATVSKECGSSNCKFCIYLCKVLNNILEKDHCLKEARKD